MTGGPLPQHRLRPGFRWPENTLWDDVVGHAHRGRDATAVTDGETTYTYGELVRAAEAAAGRYRDLGVGVGDVVMVRMPTSAAFLPAFLAVERLSAVVSPVLPGITGSAFERIVGLSAPSLIVTNDPVESDGIDITVVDPVSVLDPPNGAPTLPDPPRPSAVSELAYTSGTTGTPKGVVHTHATCTAGILSTIRRQHISAEDVVHVSLPVAHNFGYFYGVRLGLHAGAKLVMQRRWNAPEMLSLVATHGVTVSLGPPTYLSDLLDVAGSWGGRLDTLRLFTCAGAKLDRGLATDAVAALPGRISKAFGMTELGHVCSTTAGSGVDKILATEGAPHPEIEMRVQGSTGDPLPRGEEGVVAFRGPFVMAGYRDGTGINAIDESGFFSTGDLGYADANGYLVITGRVKNIVIRGGENIPAEPVEAALGVHKDVLEAVVVAAPDRRLGERPVVCVVPRPGATVTVADLGPVLEEAGLPRIHWPEAVVMLDEIPRSETGKVKRAELRRVIAERRIFEEADTNE